MKFNNLIPELSVSNFYKSLNFYTTIIGFKIEYQRSEAKFALISFQGSQLMIEEINNNWFVGKLKYPFGRGINFQIEIKNIKPLLKSLKNNNYKIFVKPQDNWYRQGKKLLGCREFLIQDPDGYLLRFSQDLGVKSVK